MKKLFPALLILILPFLSRAQSTSDDPSRLTLDRIFSGEFRMDYLGPFQWLEDGNAYTKLERSTGMGISGSDIVKYDIAIQERSVLVMASELVPEGRTNPLAVEGYSWSGDMDKLLVFTNSQRVWRTNTRGDYWLFDMNTKKLTLLGATRPESTLDLGCSVCR